jgi:hypothetical protein
LGFSPVPYILWSLSHNIRRPMHFFQLRNV